MMNWQPALPIIFSLSGYDGRVVRGSGCGVTEGGGLWESESSGQWFLLLLRANKLARHLAEVSFLRCAELIVAVSLLADDQFAAAVPGVEPFGVCHSAAAGAV